MEVEFRGHQVGVRLEQRAPDDLHVAVRFLIEDDENWFEMKNGFSSYWMPDFDQVWLEANRWMQANCDRDVDKEGVSWGWRFREASSVKVTHQI